MPNPLKNRAAEHLDFKVQTTYRYYSLKLLLTFREDSEFSLMLASFLRLEIGCSLSIAGLLGSKLDGIGRSEVISS
jgi:hypothetical protein